MLILSPRARLLALISLLILAVGILVLIWQRPPPEPGLQLPSELPSIAARSQPASGASGSPQLEPEVLLAVGDIATCNRETDEAVADLASRLPGTIALLGDVVYERGTPDEFAQCFDPAWGPMRSRLRPAPGNHEYETDDAAGYFDYFGSAAGSPGEGWYSFDVGAWHVVALNSNCQLVGCGSDSPQLRWLREDLRENPSSCLLAYWHHARWSSGRHGSSADVDPLWEEVVGTGADVVLSGHDHTYERLLVDGVRQFVVGTGGRSLYPFHKSPLPETEARSADAYGLLWLSLYDGAYSWDFIGLGTSGFTDAGDGDCN